MNEEPIEVKPLISAPTDNATAPIEVKPLVSDPIVPSRPRPCISRGRRKLFVGGVTAVAIVGGGAVAMTVIRRTSQNRSPVTPTISPVRFTPGQPILRLTGYTGTVASIIWSPDGHYLAASGADYGSFALVWDITASLHQSSLGLQTVDQPIRTWSYDRDGFENDQVVSWTPDGRYLVTALLDASFSNQTPALLDPFNRTSKPRIFTMHNVKHSYFWSPVMSPQGSILAAVDNPSMYRYHKIALWQFQASMEPYASLTYRDDAQFIGDASGIGILSWSSDGGQLAGLGDREVVVWETKNRTVTAVVKLPERVQEGKYARVLTGALSWSPSNPHLLAVTNFDTIAVINVQQKKVLYQLFTDDKGALNATEDPHDSSIFYPSVLGVTWSPDGRYLAGCYTRSPKVFVWDLQAKNARTEHGLMLQSSLFPLDDSTNQTDTINDLSWSPNGRYLATASSGQSITVWQVGE